MKKRDTTRTMTRRSRRCDSLFMMAFLTKPVITLLLMICLNKRVGMVVQAWTPSRSSSFVIGGGGRAMTVQSNMMISSSSCCKSHLQAHQWTMYQESNSNDRSMASSDPKHNAWAVLSKTEAWISSTLANANSQQSSTTSTGSTSSSSSSSTSSSSNPYVRKEVSYYCENQTTSPIIMIASIFRHIKDIRIIGEQHIASEIQRMRNNNHRDIEPSTMRQTHVIVIPSIPEVTSSFVLFDTIVQRINTARRNARDYIVTDTTTREDDVNNNRELQEKFSVAINCAHLHPSFGQQQQQISSTTRSKTVEDDKVENDPKYIEYQKQRLLARQSPYPTIVVEVRVTPTPDFFIDTTAANTAATPSKSYLSNPDRGSVSLSDIQKLEALFSKSAHIKEVEPPKEQQTYTDDYLWDHLLGNSIREVTSSRRRTTISPIEIAQEWIQQSQSKQSSSSSSSSSSVSFTTTDTSHVDAAYEFVFLNIAMLLENHNTNDDDNTNKSSGTSTGSSNDSSNGIYYLVFPNYLRYAATSFEKFVNEIQNIYTAATTIETISSSSSVPAVVSFTTYHPEHVEPSNRSPLPILAIQRTKMNSS